MGECVQIVTIHDAPRPVMFAAGLPAGSHVSDNLKQKIWGDKYVDLSELLPNNNSPAYTMSMNDTGNVPTLQFAPQKRRPLTENEWSAAWDDYFAIYIQKHMHHITDMITYSRHVKELMNSGANWRHYDQQFRSDREFSHFEIGQIESSVNPLWPATPGLCQCTLSSWGCAGHILHSQTKIHFSQLPPASVSARCPAGDVPARFTLPN